MDFKHPDARGTDSIPLAFPNALEFNISPKYPCNLSYRSIAFTIEKVLR
jgi:hypothetical protein